MRFIRSGLFFLIVLQISFYNYSYANVVTSRPLAYDSRMRVYVYSPGYVYKYVGHYNFQSHIKFEAGEVIKTMSMGDPSGWEMVPSGNRLFLRPLSKRAKTNMTLITNKRIYYFELDAKKAKSMKDKSLAFQTSFLYSNSKDDNVEIILDDEESVVDLANPEKYNFNYTYSGSELIAPQKIFDDGDFTYFEFADNISDLPAIFYVDSDGYEGIVNFRVKNNYIIVERVSAVFTLRHGVDTLCVFNENLKQRSL